MTKINAIITVKENNLEVTIEYGGEVLSYHPTSYEEAKGDLADMTTKLALKDAEVEQLSGLVKDVRSCIEASFAGERAKQRCSYIRDLNLRIDKLSEELDSVDEITSQIDRMKTLGKLAAEAAEINAEINAYDVDDSDENESVIMDCPIPKNLYDRDVLQLLDLAAAKLANEESEEHLLINRLALNSIQNASALLDYKNLMID